MEQDKSWLYIDRTTPAFDNGLQRFLQFAKKFANKEGKIRCPCKNCINTVSQTFDAVYAHCFDLGWAPGYTTWFHHGEKEVPRKRPRTTQVVVEAGDETVPPHRDPFRVPAQCEDDHVGDDDINEQGAEWIPQPPPKKKQGERGSAKGYNVQALKRKLGGPIPIIWDPHFPTLRKPVGEYSTEFESELGKIMRSHVPCYTDTWAHVPAQQKELIWEELRSSFTPLEPNIHRIAVVAEAGVLFRKWKSRLKKSVDQHVAKKRPGPCPKADDVDSQEEWNEYLRYINTPGFKKKSDQNKMNRAGQKYVCRQGRKPLSGVRWIRLNMRNINDIEREQLGGDPIEIWADKHKNREGAFVNAVAEAAYKKLLEVAARIAPGRIPTFDEEKQIFIQALGKRRDYLIGLGPTQTDPSSSSSQSSQSQLSYAYHGDCNMKISQLEKALQKTQDRMAKKSKKQEAALSRLMSSLQTWLPDLSLEVIPESSDEDEDDDEDAAVDLDGA